jgi:uncharacterized protein (TIGR03663 family)
MHADEAIHADRLGRLLDGGGYAYDPRDYHGPTLVYMSVVPAALSGERRYADLDETTLRLAPAVTGMALVLVHLAAAPYVGSAGAAAGALLAAVSPAMVYYSRDYIHEVPLVFFTLGALLAAARYLQRPGSGPAAFFGACAGLMMATKETAPLALLSMLAAFAFVGGFRGRPESARPARSGRHLLLALLAGVAAAAPLFSSFFTHPAGLADAVRAYGHYLHRGSTWSWHVHAWPYYLGLLLRFPARGTPLWTEALVLGLAVVGALAAWRRPPPVPDVRALRFFAVYTLVTLVLYSSIPYKTPWCVLSFLDGMALLGGVGAAVLLRVAPSRWSRATVAALLVAGGAHLAWQAWMASFRYAADPRNPWVYAQTSPDVFAIVSAVEDLARADPQGRGLPIQVISDANVWPLPWYLRRFPHVAWWTGVSETAGNAPLVLATPDMEPALVRRMYEVPPPGERELYVPIFPRPMELRPGVELRGYASYRLWEAHLSERER